MSDAAVRAVLFRDARELFLDISEPSRRLDAVKTAVSVEERDPRGVVAPVLKRLETLHEVRD